MKVSVIQFNPIWSKVQYNLEQLTILIQQLNSTTDLVVLPEMFSTGFNMNPDEQLINDQLIVEEWMQSLADSCQFAITGTYMFNSNGQLFNRMIFARPDNEPLYYDKRHLFSYGGENNHFTAGHQRLIWNYKGWKIKPVVCYDLRFPVWLRNDIKADFDLLICTANWPEKRIQHWNKLLQARAIENLAYVVGANRFGEEPTGIVYNGQSLFVDGSGEVIKTMNDGEIVCTCTLDLDRLKEYRKQFRFLDDRDNFELYV